MLNKEKLKETIDKFPDEFSIDELIERLIFLDKVERGNAQSEKGEIIAEEQLEQEMKKWFE